MAQSKPRSFGLSALEEQAKAAMRCSQWLTAIELWEKVRRQDPEYLGAYISGVESLIRAYRMTEASQLSEELESLFSESVSANVFLATYAGRKGRWHESVERFERVAARSPRQYRKVMANPSYRQSVMNAEGIIAGSNRLSTITHDQVKDNFETLDVGEPGASYVFVSGMPRSGTTALGHLLNSHPSVALFTEVQNPYLAYSAASFSKEMLKMRSSENPASVPEGIVERVGSASYIGDKRPLFQYSLPHSVKAMLSERVVVFHILRPIAHVAASYHKRALDPEDGWDPLRDLSICIDEFNRMNEFLLEWNEEEYMGRKHSFRLVDYSRIFSDEQYALDLFDELALPDTTRVRASVQKLLEKSKKIMSKPRPIDEQILESIKSGLDFGSARAVERYTDIEILPEI